MQFLKLRNWIFNLIFSTLLGNMNAHQVQLVTYHEKTNGMLIRIVVSNTPNVKQIDLATYTRGVYFLEITTDNGVVNKKLILQ